MKASEIVKLYDMQPHEENGLYAERHYPAESDERPASGSIYYYLGPDEASLFHVIDCDEYWCYCAGEPLEIWQISPDGKLCRSMLGIGEGCQPLVWIKAGNIFGARHLKNAQDGCFVSCITVPRFKYEAWKLIEEQEIVKRFPETEEFFGE